MWVLRGASPASGSEDIRSQGATIPWQKEPCWEVRACHKDRMHIQVALGYLEGRLCKPTCCLGFFFTLSSCERALNHSGEATELNPATFTKSYCVTKCCPSPGSFSTRETPKISFLNDFCTVHRSANVKPFFKKTKPLIQKLHI